MLEAEKIFRHGTLSSFVYSFAQLSGNSSSGLVDFSTRITWCVTDLSPRDHLSPFSKGAVKPRWERGVYGCHGRCEGVNLTAKTFTPTLLYHENTDREWKTSVYKMSEQTSSPEETPELRQRLLQSAKYFRGHDLFYRATDVQKETPLNVPVKYGALNSKNIDNGREVDQTMPNADKKTKKYRCQYCNVTCTNNGQLKGHLRVHTGEKPYTCSFMNCGRSFARNEELTRHRRIHSGIRPHQCLTCGKYFGRKDHLNKHTKTHLKSCDKKNYLCKVQNCEQKYTRSDALARHQWSMHGIKPKSSSKWKS